LSGSRAFDVQDFVKWKGPLFHKFTLSLVDSSQAVRCLAQFLLADTLALKVRPRKPPFPLILPLRSCTLKGRCLVSKKVIG